MSQALGHFLRGMSVVRWILIPLGILLVVCVGLFFLGGSRFLILVPSVRNQEMRNRTRHDFHQMITGLTQYRIDTGAFPAAIPHPSPAALEGLTTFAETKELFLHTWEDPFGWIEKQQPYVYFTSGTGWSLSSAGPDRDYDFNPAQLYEPGLTLSEPRILPLLYDPTNGTSSNGDIIRLSEPPAASEGTP